MSSNYPPGVSENTYGAPWNDISFSIDIRVDFLKTITIDGPRSIETLEEIKQEYITDLVKKIRELTEEFDDIKIKDIIAENE